MRFFNSSYFQISLSYKNTLPPLFLVETITIKFYLMKNVNLLSKKVFALIFLATIFTNCNDANKDKPKPEVVEPEEIEAPKDIISLDEADAIYANYSKHRVPAIENYETRERSPSEKFEAARFVDFDYDTIKEYLKYVDQEAQKADVKKVTKLRLYFANYPDKEVFPNRKKIIHPRQNSIFIVPTMAADGGDFGFFIGDDGKAQLIKNRKPGDKNNSNKSEASLLPAFNTSLYAGKSLTLNRGGSGPPPFGDF